jgi:hypothetical protein
MASVAAIRTRGGAAVSPTTLCVLNVGIGWRAVGDLKTPGKYPSVPVAWGLVGPQKQSGRCGKRGVVPRFANPYEHCTRE